MRAGVLWVLLVKSGLVLFGPWEFPVYDTHGVFWRERKRESAKRVVTHSGGKEACRQQRSHNDSALEELESRNWSRVWRFTSRARLRYLKRYFFCPRSRDRAHRDSGNPGCVSETRWPDEQSHTETIRRETEHNCLFCRSTKHDEADLTPGILHNYLKHRLTF